MSLKAAHLQALFARRREAEHNRVERTEAVNKYFNHWGKVTARFENWTAPDYYKQAEQQFESAKQQKEQQEKLAKRREKLSHLLEMEKSNCELEIQEKQRNKNSRRSIDTKTLEKIDENLKRQEQIRHRLELEAKLYGKWRHGVEDDTLIFNSKSDNEVLAKLNWLDKQVDQQLQREKEEEAVKECQLKLQQEINKSEELRKERQQIREKEIHEIRCMQEYHLDQLKERQKETEALKQKENKLQGNLMELKKELELLDESNAVLSRPAADFSRAYNLKNIKLFIRKRSQVYRNQIELCCTILQRTLEFAEKPEILKHYQQQLAQQLDKESEKLSQIEGMYESEAKYSLQGAEDLWKQEQAERYKELKQILLNEHRNLNTTLNEVIKRHEELVEIRSTHLSIIENSTEKLKLLIQEEENSPRQEVKTPQHVNFTPHAQTTNSFTHTQLEESADTPLYSPRLTASHDKTSSLEPKETPLPVAFSTRRNCQESLENNMSPRSTDVKRISNSFNNLNLDAWQSDQDDSSPHDLAIQQSTSQRSLQVVTPETEANRPRFGRKHVAWN